MSSKNSKKSKKNVKFDLTDKYNYDSFDNNSERIIRSTTYLNDPDVKSVDLEGAYNTILIRRRQIVNIDDNISDSNKDGNSPLVAPKDSVSQYDANERSSFNGHDDEFEEKEKKRLEKLNKIKEENEKLPRWYKTDYKEKILEIEGKFKQQETQTNIHDDQVSENINAYLNKNSKGIQVEERDKQTLRDSRYELFRRNLHLVQDDIKGFVKENSTYSTKENSINTSDQSNSNHSFLSYIKRRNITKQSRFTNYDN